MTTTTKTGARKVPGGTCVTVLSSYIIRVYTYTCISIHTTRVLCTPCVQTGSITHARATIEMNYYEHIIIIIITSIIRARVVIPPYACSYLHYPHVLSTRATIATTGPSAVWRDWREIAWRVSVMAVSPIIFIIIIFTSYALYYARLQAHLQWFIVVARRHVARVCARDTRERTREGQRFR